MFKFLYTQEKPNIYELQSGSYSHVVLNSILNNGNDVLKFLFSELKEYKEYWYMAFKNGIRLNHDFANFLLEIVLFFLMRPLSNLMKTMKIKTRFIDILLKK